MATCNATHVSWSKITVGAHFIINKHKWWRVLPAPWAAQLKFNPSVGPRFSGGSLWFSWHCRCHYCMALANYLSSR